MVNECLNCGAGLRYDIALARLKCDNCDSTFDPSEYVSKTDAAEEAAYDNYDATVFTCPNCGAELAGNEADAVDYCMYCGSFVTLNSHIAKLKKPSGILPFEKTKEECTAIYKKMIRKKFYAPKEFRDESFLSGFRGAYIPYWIYDFQYGPEVKISGSEDSREGDYIVTQHYHITASMNGKVEGFAYDASSTFDDSINQSIAPFDSTKMKEFNSSYLFGFFSDTPDVEEDLIHEEAMTVANDLIWDAVTDNKKLKSGHPDKPKSNKQFASDFNIREEHRLALLPIWFLTWKKGDRVAYSAVNGESGAIYSEVPVDPLRYCIITLLTAIPLFFLLNCTATFLGNEMLTIAMLLSVVTIFLYMTQLENIARRYFHADDKGYLSVHEHAKAKVDSDVSENLILLLWDFIKDIFHIDKKTNIIVYLLVMGITLFALSDIIGIGLIIALVLLPFYVIYRIVKCSNLLNDKTVYIDVAGSMIAFLVSGVILLVDPAQDYFYYIAAIGCIIAIMLTAFFTIRRYNQLITRPIPRWEEGSK